VLPGFLLSGRDSDGEYHHYAAFTVWNHPSDITTGPPLTLPDLWADPSLGGYAEAGYKYYHDWPVLLHQASDFTLCGYNLLRRSLVA
jgi:hypothetical protein